MIPKLHIYYDSESDYLEIRFGEPTESHYEKIGIDILYKSLAKPMWFIAANSGTDAGWVVKKVEAGKTHDYGFNALTMEFGSMLAAGIVDPAKVTRLALQNAVSVGSMVLTTESLITDIPEKKESMPAMPPGGGEY